MRKSFILISLVSVFALMLSCKSSVDYTPYISFSEFILNPEINAHDSIIGGEDTLMIKYDESLNTYIIDSIQVGDTVVFAVCYGSRGNDLKSASIQTDTTAVQMKCMINDLIREILVEPSSEEKMQFYFKSDYNGVVFRVFYTPKKLGSHKMTFKVESDSKFSPVTQTFIQNVRE